MAFISAPLSINICTHSVCPPDTAKWSGDAKLLLSKEIFGLHPDVRRNWSAAMKRLSKYDTLGKH